MDPTMRQLIKDVVKLRKEMNVTQQEVSTLAGEPCRTFLAHLEQGRKTHINLRKLYGVLHVLFNKNKGQRMSDNYATLSQVQQLVENAVTTLREEIAATRNAPLVQRSKTPKIQHTHVGVYVDEIVCNHSILNPVNRQEILRLLKLRVDAGEIELWGTSRKTSILSGKYLKTGGVNLRCSGVETYLAANSMVFTGTKTPDKYPHVKFLRLADMVYAPNPHYPWQPQTKKPATPSQVAPTPIQSVQPVAPVQPNQLLDGLTQAETDYAANTFGHGPSKDFGWLHLAHPWLFNTLKTKGRATKEQLHKAVHDEISLIESRGLRAPTRQKHELVTDYLLWLSALGKVHLTRLGVGDLMITLPIPPAVTQVATQSVQ